MTEEVFINQIVHDSLLSTKFKKIQIKFLANGALKIIFKDARLLHEFLRKT